MYRFRYILMELNVLYEIVQLVFSCLDYVNDLLTRHIFKSLVTKIQFKTERLCIICEYSTAVLDIAKASAS